MTGDRRVTQAVLAMLANPWGPEATDRARAAQILAALADLPERVRGHARRGEKTSIDRLLLAVAHAQATTGVAVEAVLAPPWMDGRAWEAASRPRAAYVRIAMAASRALASLEELRGGSTLMRAVRREAWAACFGDSLAHALDLERVIRDHDVLLLGETGTGKDALAKAIQQALPGDSDGGPAPSATINAAAIPETLIEAELFGHAKGAYTGATQARAGRIRSADRGSFFLDEVGDLPLTTQVKLLRVVESDEVTSLGSDRVHRVEARYIAATHRDLEAMVERGEFRRDLYQRLAGVVVRLPPLREHREDIPEIGMHFVERYLRGPQWVERAVELRRWLEEQVDRAHPWSGNVRELENVIRNLLLGIDPWGAAPPGSPAKATGAAVLPPAIAEGTAPLRAVRDWYVERVLERSNGNFAAAARILRVDRTTARRLARRRALHRDRSD